MSAFVPFYDFAAVASISMSQSGDANDATRNSVEPVRRSSSRAFTVHSLKGAVNRVIIDRAQAIRGRMALHGLYIPINAPWAAEFKRELLTLPAGKHDDQVDAIGLIGQLLDLLIPGTKPKEPEKRRWEPDREHLGVPAKK